MYKNFKPYLRLIFISVTVAMLSACATPTTKSEKIGKHELKQERNAQRELAKQQEAKKIARKHKDLAIYETRLRKIADPLANAAQQIGKAKKRTYKYKILDKKGLIAYTDGTTVVFTPEMMDFLETDKELAVVVAHELSHNIMGHIGKKQINVILGSFVDIAAAVKGINTGGLFGNIGGMTYSQAFENEADYVAIYVMALAGYDISNVHEVWRKLTIQTNSGVDSEFFSSHPSNPERYLRMKRTIAEVQTKQAAGQKLEPNFA